MAGKGLPPKRSKLTKAQLDEECSTFSKALEAVHADRDELIKTAAEQRRLLDEWQVAAARLKTDCEVLEVKIEGNQVVITERDDQIKKLKTWVDTLNKDKETLAERAGRYQAIADALFDLSATAYTPPALATALAEKLRGTDISKMQGYITASLAEACSDAAEMAWHRAQALKD